MSRALSQLIDKVETLAPARRAQQAAHAKDVDDFASHWKATAWQRDGQPTMVKPEVIIPSKAKPSAVPSGDAGIRSYSGAPAQYKTPGVEDVAPGRAAPDAGPSINSNKSSFSNLKDKLFSGDNGSAIKKGLWGAGIGAVGGGILSTQNDSSTMGSIGMGALIGGIGGAAAQRMRSFRAKNTLPDKIAKAGEELSEKNSSLNRLNQEIKDLKPGRKSSPENKQKYNSAVNNRNKMESQISHLEKQIAGNKAIVADPNVSAMKWGMIGAGGSFAVNSVTSNTPVNPTPKQF